MTNNKLVSEIITIKTNNLDSYVSRYFDTHLQNKQDILTTVLRYKSLLKVDACIWALVIALDGQYFNELIVDEYVSYEIFKDLRFIAGNSQLDELLSNECIVRIALAKEFRYMYQLSPFRILDAILFADRKMEDDIIEAFARIVETQSYARNPIFKNCSLTYIREEMRLLKSIFSAQKVLTLPPALVFYALHDIIYADICLENLGLDKGLIQSEINIILSDKEVRSIYVKIPGLLTSTIRYIDQTTFDTNFSFDEILQSITSGSYFSCKTSTFRELILYISSRWPNRFDEFENALLEYIKKDDFFVEYHSILYLTILESALRKFKNPQAFIDSIIALPIAYDLFCDFKKGNATFPKFLKRALENYNIKFDYIVNLVSQVIDDESQDELLDFQSFKNLFE